MKIPIKLILNYWHFTVELPICCGSFFSMPTFYKYVWWTKNESKIPNISPDHHLWRSCFLLLFQWMWVHCQHGLRSIPRHFVRVLLQFTTTGGNFNSPDFPSNDDYISARNWAMKGLQYILALMKGLDDMPSRTFALMIVST